MLLSRSPASMMNLMPRVQCLLHRAPPLLCNSQLRISTNRPPSSSCVAAFSSRTHASSFYRRNRVTSSSTLPQSPSPSSSSSSSYRHPFSAPHRVAPRSTHSGREELNDNYKLPRGRSSIGQTEVNHAASRPASRIEPRSTAASSSASFTRRSLTSRSAASPSHSRQTHQSSFQHQTFNQRTPAPSSHTSSDDIESDEFERYLIIDENGKRKRMAKPNEEEEHHDRPMRRSKPILHERYTDRRDAPQRPKWLPDEVPYKLVAPSPAAINDWSTVLEKYQVADHLRHQLTLPVTPTRTKKYTPYEPPRSSAFHPRNSASFRKNTMTRKEKNRRSHYMGRGSTK